MVETIFYSNFNENEIKRSVYGLIMLQNCINVHCSPLLLHNLTLSSLDKTLRRFHIIIYPIRFCSIGNPVQRHFPTVNLQILLKEAKLSGLVLLRCLHCPEKVTIRLQNPENLHFKDFSPISAFSS